MNGFTMAEPPIARIGNFQPVLPKGRTGIGELSPLAGSAPLSAAAVPERTAAPAPAKTPDFKKPRRSTHGSAARVLIFDMLRAPILERLGEWTLGEDR